MATTVEALRASARVKQVLNEHVPDTGEFSLDKVVLEVIAWLELNEPTTLAEWKNDLAQEHLRDTLRGVLRSRRVAARTAYMDDPTRAIKKAGALFERTVMTVDEHGHRLRVGEMTGADHTYVARQYRHSSEREAMLATFHEAVAKRVGSKRTEDVLTEEQYQELYRSLTRVGA
jgi:hypothetical protein